MQKLSDCRILTSLISRLLFIFLTSIIYIPVNNLVLISSLSSEKESLFWITRQLTLKVGLMYADFSYHLSAVPQNVFLVTFKSGLCSPPGSILTVTDFMLIQSPLFFSFGFYIYLHNCFKIIIWYFNEKRGNT